MKRIVFILFYLLFASSIFSQVKFDVSVPLLQFQATNIDELRDGFTNDYINHFYLPNFQVNARYKKFILGFRHYYNSRSNYEGQSFSGKLFEFQIKSYSILSGLNVLESRELEWNAGLGYTRNSSWVGFYNLAVGQLEGLPCYTKNPHAMILWSDVKYKINSKFNIGLNIAVSPMFSEFEYCAKTTHTKYQFFVTQLMLGYRF